MRWLVIVFGFLAFTSPVSAHGVGEAWSSEATWTADPLILVPLYIFAVIFLTGTIRLWRNAGFGRGTRLRQVACFWIGWTVLALALLSPLHWLSEHLLSAHMVEHELIMAVAAPLLVLSRPLGVFVWAIPQTWRVAFAQTLVIPILVGLGSEPIAATALHSATIWAWHLPPLFDAALANRWVHMAQHVSFLATALWFWWAVLNVPLARRGLAAFHLFHNDVSAYLPWSLDDAEFAPALRELSRASGISAQPARRPGTGRPHHVGARLRHLRHSGAHAVRPVDIEVRS